MNVDGLELELDDSGRVVSRADDLLARLRWLVDAYLDGALPGLLESIETRAPRDDGALFARPVDSAEDLRSASEAWRARTGSGLGSDVYCLALRWRGPDLFLPRLVLLKVLREVAARKRG